MSLFEQGWEVPGAKGTVVLVHGMGEHSGRYRHVARYLNEHAYSVRTGDLPGWGQSAGRKGDIRSFDQYVEAVRRWIRHAADTNPTRPLFLLGHSMGGLVAVRFMQTAPERSQVTGLILSSPCLKLRLAVPPWKAALSRVLLRLAPGLRMPSGVDADDVSRDPAVRELYRTDPHNFSRVSVRWYHELLRAMELAREESARLTVPLLVLQAGDDRLIDAAAVEDFAQEAPSEDKTFCLLPGLYHEVFNEPEREDALNRMVVWLDERASAADKM